MSSQEPLIQVCRQAIALVDDGSPHQAMNTLLQTWQNHPAPGLADVIVDLGRALDERPSLRGANQQDQWLQVAAQRDPLDLNRLMHSLVDGTAAQAAQRAEALVEWDPDPRRDRGVCHLFREPLFRATTTRPFWRVMLRLVESIQDPACLPMMREVPKLYKARFSTTNGQWLGDQVHKLIPALQTAASDWKNWVPDNELRPLLEQLSQTRLPQKTTQSIDHLFLAVAAEPWNDDPRRVLADMLLDQGDPRGTFISLQLNKQQRSLDKPERALEKQLIADHGEDWLGPLANKVRKGFRFDRGFVV